MECDNALADRRRAAQDLLNAFIVKNKNGVWFLKISENRLQTLAKWLWPVCIAGIENPTVIGD